MCSEMGSSGTGMQLLALAIMTIIANLLLYFSNGQVLEPAQITDLFWFFHGLLEAGLLVMVRALMLLREGRGGCCAHRCVKMLFPVLLAMQGTMEAVYHVAISLLGLFCGPFCDAGSGTYTYPFRHNTMEDNYLFNQLTWATCQEPEHIILWNDLLSILLGIGVLEAMLCLLQVASGLCNIFCGTCVGKGQVDITGS